MGMTMAYGKVITYEGNKIGLKSIITYKDQNGVESKIHVGKLVKLAEKCKNPRMPLTNWIELIKNNNLSIGAPLMDMLHSVATEFGIKKMEKEGIFVD